MTASKIIGIDLGGTSIKFGILTLDGEVQDKWWWLIDSIISGTICFPSSKIFVGIDHLS